MDIYSFGIKKNKKYIKKFIQLFILYILYAFSEVYLFSYLISIVIKLINKNVTNINSISKNIIFGLIFYIFSFYIYKKYHTKTLVNFRLEIRETLFNLLMKSNDNSFTNKNYQTFHSLINRLSITLYVIYNYLSTYALPSIIYTIIILIVLLKNNKSSFIFLLFVNLVMILFIKSTSKKMNKKSINYELQNTNIETKQIEKITLIDKITNRGLSELEIKNFKNDSKLGSDKGINFFHYMLKNETILLGILNITIFVIIYILFKNKVNNKTLIITLLLLYRNKVDISIQKMNEIINYASVIDLVSKHFDNKIIKNYYNIKTRHFEECTKISFKNVHFRYKNQKYDFLKNFNLEIDFRKNKIISLMGKSGKGKSTLCKLLLKIYNIDKGDILINNISISNLSSKEIKKKITYINQNSKLFNENIEYNLEYGCNSKICKKYLQEILKSNDLQFVFNDKIENIKKIKSGFLGENISGGQRQIVNVLNGLIHTSDILILDEPTNNLSYSLKIRLLKTINQFKKYKKGILIITHDKDVLSIVDKNIHI
jgi:ATP-binding cassette subfamily C protein